MDRVGAYLPGDPNGLVGETEKLPQAGVQMDFPCVEVYFQDADPRSLQRELVPLRQTLKLALTTVDFLRMRLANIIEIAGDEDRQNDQQTGEQNHRAYLPRILRGRRPPCCGDGGDLPAPAGKGDLRRNRFISENTRIAKENGSAFTRCILAANGDLQRQVRIRQSAGLVQPFGIDHRGNEAPEMPVTALFIDKHRKSPDETLAALQQVDGSGQHHLLGRDRPQRRFPLLFILAIVEPDRLLVAFDRIHQAHDHSRRTGDVAQLRVIAHQPVGNLAELFLVHRRLRCNDGNQAADQLDIAGDVAFEFRPHKAELLADLCPGTLMMDDAVLVLGEHAGCHRDRERNPGSQHGWP
jgi:hypothetical protein